MKTVADWVKYLQLLEHPEGGYYAETYRSPSLIPHSALPDNFSGDRNYSTAIYYLLGSNDRSAIRRLQADEIWHFYAGDRLEISVIHPDGRLETIALGSDPAQGETFQALVPAGTWFGARPVQGTYALAGCTMAPGFDFADFEIGNREELVSQFPQHTDLIVQLT